MNPHRASWGFAYDMPFAAIIAGATMLAMLIQTKQVQKLDKNSIVVLWIVFLLWTGVTTIFAFFPESAVYLFKSYFKIMLMTFVAIMLINDQKNYDHEEMFTLLKNTLDEYINSKSKKGSAEWKMAVNTILDTYMGENPVTFNYKGSMYTPHTFAAITKFNPDDYVTITSFTQQAFYSKFILNIPDNFSNGSFYNVPLNDMMGVINTALANGYTVALDVDVSEPTFSSKNGLAVLPLNAADDKKSMTEIVPEQKVTQLSRQQAFENYSTTDDHLMHITGMLTDQNGNTYYKVKNSWGTKMANGGYVYMSEAFTRMKAISIMVHKDAISKELKGLLKL